MPDLRRVKDGWTLAVLNGDELRVRPEIFSAMQEILNAPGEPTELAHKAMRCAGLTTDEINGRVFSETKIVVDYDLPIVM